MIATLSNLELIELTGCSKPAAQWRELLKQGFLRARRGRDGSVILEREHYLAVCHGSYNNVVSKSANEPIFTHFKRA